MSKLSQAFGWVVIMFFFVGMFWLTTIESPAKRYSGQHVEMEK